MGSEKNVGMGYRGRAQRTLDHFGPIEPTKPCMYATEVAQTPPQSSSAELAAILHAVPLPT
jgi:hypothetical protein